MCSLYICMKIVFLTFEKHALIPWRKKFYFVILVEHIGIPRYKCEETFSIFDQKKRRRKLLLGVRRKNPWV